MNELRQESCPRCGDRTKEHNWCKSCGDITWLDEYTDDQMDKVNATLFRPNESTRRGKDTTQA